MQCVSSVPGQGTKIPHAAWPEKKKSKKKKKIIKKISVLHCLYTFWVAWEEKEFTS